MDEIALLNEIGVVHNDHGHDHCSDEGDVCDDVGHVSISIFNCHTMWRLMKEWGLTHVNSNDIY